MKILLSFLLSLAIGAATRLTAVPLPAPPALVGALLVLAITLGHLIADKQLARKNRNDVRYDAPPEDGAKGAFGG